MTVHTGAFPTGSRPAPAPSVRPGREIRSLTGLRAVAALCVVLVHFQYVTGADALMRYLSPVQPLIAHGWLGVDLFFVLSGFVITLTYLHELGPRPSARGAVAFWWARVCRLWPLYALLTTLFGGWLLYKAARGPRGSMSWQTVQPVVDPLHWLEQMLMVQMWHRPRLEGSSWLLPAWSLSAEWLAYVCFPAMALLLWRLRGAPAGVTGLLAVVCMLPVGLLSVTDPALNSPYAWAVRIGCGFTAGAFACLAVRRIAVSERTDRMATRLAALTLVEIVVLLYADSARAGSTNSGALAAVTFPLLVGALAVSTRGPSRWLSTDLVVLGGRVSFALYLVHTAVFEVVWSLVQWYPWLRPGGGLLTLVLSQLLVGTLLLAYLLHRFVEEPARRALRGIGTSRPRPAVVPPVADGGTTQRFPVPAELGPPLPQPRPGVPDRVAT